MTVPYKARREKFYLDGAFGMLTAIQRGKNPSKLYILGLAPHLTFQSDQNEPCEILEFNVT